ncbi:MAG: hypothetical protein H6733_07900 [Alphaproteobacteria bacterium]|nr:hypothetical protein [Alphaproteobacteria bacterium]
MIGDVVDAPSCPVFGDLTVVNGRIDLVERTIRDLETSIDDRMLRLESAMQSSNAHLDNISRESARTNELLVQMTEQMRRREDREDRRQDQVWSASLGAASELWTTVKGPLAYLLAAVVTWMVLEHFAAPSPQAMHPYEVAP